MVGDDTGGAGISPQGSTPVFYVQIPGSGQAQWRLWTLLVLSAAVCLASGGGLLSFVTGQLDPQPQPGAPAWGQVVGTVVCLCLLFLSARGTAELEHRLRRHQPATRALDAAHAERQARLRRHHHRFSPVSMVAFCLLLSCVAVALVALGIESQSSDARSAMVQSHGTRVSAVVEAVHNHQYCQALGGGAGTSSCIPRAEILVDLSRPVRGVTRTTAHYPYLSFLRPGQRIMVLVDPRQPTYAELPDHRYRGADGWLIFAFAAAVLALLAIREGHSLARVLAVDRRHTAPAPP